MTLALAQFLSGSTFKMETMNTDELKEMMFASYSVDEGEPSCSEKAQKKRKLTIPESDESDEDQDALAAELMRRFLSQMKPKSKKCRPRKENKVLGQRNPSSDTEEARINDDEEDGKKNDEGAKMESKKTAKVGSKSKGKENHPSVSAEPSNRNGKRKSDSETVAAKKWKNDDTCKLIDLLEERVCLWDVFDRNYHNREKREKAYKEIETELEVPVAEIRKKILQLRSQLGREIAKCNKTKSGQSSDELYKPTWIYWQKLQFLRPVMQPGKSRDNLISSDSFQDSQSPSELASTTDIDSSLDIIEDQSQGTLQKHHSTPRQSRKATELKKQELFAACIDVLKEPVKEQVKEMEPKQPVCHFAMYINEKLLQFDKKIRPLVGKRISDIIFDFEQNYVPPQQINPTGVSQPNFQDNKNVVETDQTN